MLEIPAIILTFVAFFGFINYKFLKLPLTVGLVISALLFSFCIILFDFALPSYDLSFLLKEFLDQIDFNKTLMNGMLSFLLFAGALHVDLNNLIKAKLHVSLLATLGVLISTFANGIVFYFVTRIFGFEPSFIYCLIFGVIVSPTDPVAVLALLKRLKVPKKLEAIIGGESLFNDGVAVVVFSVLITIAFGSSTSDVNQSASASYISLLFAKEALGGAILGLISGYITYILLKRMDDYVLEVIATLALVTGAYTIALNLHISGPIAMVVAGVFIGNTGRNFAMSENTKRHLNDFWHLIDETLNAALFVLIGLEVIVLSFEFPVMVISLFMVLIAVLSRFLAVSIPLQFLGAFIGKEKGEISILTWAGLKGGISIALALSLPDIEIKPLILTAAYAVVVFSILIQGLTIQKLIETHHK